MNWGGIMERLYDVKLLDENRWMVKELDNEFYHTYKLIDKKNEEIYVLNHIIGLEQIKEDEFLVYERASKDDFKISRYKLTDSKIYVMYQKNFSKFGFIDSDNILFSYWTKSGNLALNGIYSISQNKEVEEADWLRYKDIVSLKQNADSSILCLSETMPEDNKLLFTVNTKNFEPNSQCYSTLRNSFVDIKSKEDYLKLKSEEINYIRIVRDIEYISNEKAIAEAKIKLIK